MTDTKCQFLDGGCLMLARHLWRFACPRCGSFKIMQVCDEHHELIEGRYDTNRTVTHTDEGTGCQMQVSSKEFYTYVGKA
mgnify:CR=1 FL=1